MERHLIGQMDESRRRFPLILIKVFVLSTFDGVLCPTDLQLERLERRNARALKMMRGAYYRCWPDSTLGPIRLAA